jgi:hypothetical protein
MLILLTQCLFIFWSCFLLQVKCKVESLNINQLPSVWVMGAVCDDSCREIVLDPSNELLVCTISGRCFDRWITPAEEDDAEPVSNNVPRVHLFISNMYV